MEGSSGPAGQSWGLHTFLASSLRARSSARSASVGGPSIVPCSNISRPSSPSNFMLCVNLWGSGRNAAVSFKEPGPSEVCAPAQPGTICRHRNSRRELGEPQLCPHGFQGCLSEASPTVF